MWTDPKSFVSTGPEDPPAVATSVFVTCMSAHEQNRKLVAIAINGFIVGNCRDVDPLLRESRASSPLLDATLVPLAGEKSQVGAD